MARACAFSPLGNEFVHLQLQGLPPRDFMIEVHGGIEVVLTVEMGLGGREVLYCQNILKIYKPTESAFSAISHSQL
jgi:hypothetical protein